MIKENIVSVKDRVLKACERVNRSISDITIIAVTKTVQPPQINEAVSCGIDEIGESKVQEAQSKLDYLSKSIKKKHFIGHLQTNKAKKVVELFDMIQSVDSLRLAQEINKFASNINKIQDCLLEVKVSREDTKFGLSSAELDNVLNHIENLRNLKICGIMAMAPYFDDPQEARPYFKKAKEIFDNIRTKYNLQDFNVLSMGMSGDFETAIEEGATMVRIGSAIFGERIYT